MRFATTIWLAAALGLPTITANQQTCQEIAEGFRNAAVDNVTNICDCMYAGTFATIQGIKIGCSSSSISHIYDALQSLNNTELGTLVIRDSLVNVLPSNIFENVKPTKLYIERCFLALVRNNTIGSIGSGLQFLSLRSNKLKKIESDMFTGLNGLKTLDLSENKISVIDKDAFADCGQLEELILNDNEISEIEDGAFKKLKNLKALSLISNKMTTINKDTFNGLDQLEILQLQDNDIESIDWSAFKKMKNLKTLNVGNNHISMVDVRGFENLEKLHLNNNSIETLKNVKLRNLPSLLLLALDRNRITSIGDLDFVGLSQSTRLESLTLVSNNISEIGPRAFTHVQNLRTLSLQNDFISSLSNKNIPILAPMKKLETLQLSGNQLTEIKSDELPKSIINLALDHNLISHIAQGTLDEVALKRLYLNNNRLQFLYPGAFDKFDLSTIEAVDLGSNSWECDCKSSTEWLPGWLEDAGDADLSEGPLRCLAIPKCGRQNQSSDDNAEETKQSTWITAAATTLAVLSLVILLVIVYLYLKDTPHMLKRGQRANSDLHKLIDNDPLSMLSDSMLVLPQPIYKKNPVQGVGVEKKVRFEEN